MGGITEYRGQILPNMLDPPAPVVNDMSLNNHFEKYFYSIHISEEPDKVKKEELQAKVSQTQTNISEAKIVIFRCKLVHFVIQVSSSSEKKRAVKMS